ncbi:phage tail tape measure protein [Cypionkella psychrotolerans]|uniref:phage tail tape measure protein n=1 Tax=Cypionkella psychrotolerans TaxID=1678131 RepID=UPI0006B48D27|nr:phage tail tape measure protein [Cypionkella psychrotolerans]
MDMTAAMELRVKNDQAKAALAATKAEIKGVGTAAAEASVEGKKLGPAIEVGVREATPEVMALKRELAGVQSGSILAGNGARQMGMQLSQVGQQTMATGDFVQALAIQLPDIGLGFGTIGMAAGLLAGIALPLVMSAFDSLGTKTKSVGDAIDFAAGKIDEFRTAVGNINISTDDLTKKFGEASGAVQRAFDLIANLKADEAQRSIDGLATSLAGLFGSGGGGEARTGVAAFFDANIFMAFTDAGREAMASARELTAAFVDQQTELANSNGDLDAQLSTLTQMLQTVNALAMADGSVSEAEQELIAQISTALGLVADQVALTRELEAGTFSIVDAATQAGVAIEGAYSAMMALASSAPGSGWLSGAIGDAATLAATLWDAAAAKASAAADIAAGAAVKRIPGGLDALANGDIQASGGTFHRPIRPKKTAGATGVNSGGGAAKIDPDSFNALTKAAEDALEKLENAVAGIHEKVRLGLMSTAEGTKAIASAKDQAANSIADLIPKLEKVADAAGPKAAAAVAKWRAEVKGLVGDLNEASAGLADRLSSNFEKGFADFLSGAKKGKAAMADFKNFVIQQLAAIAAERFTQSIITPFIDSLLGGITGGLSGGTAVEANAAGGVYSGPGISAYSGTVVSRPTFFPFAKGVGLMGEAGEEAILPLDRDGSGRLGVRASGGGGGNMIVNISTPAGTKASSTERSQGGDRIIEVMIEMVRTAIAGDITQGRGPIPDSMSNTYGLSRVGR